MYERPILVEPWKMLRHTPSPDFGGGQPKPKVRVGYRKENDLAEQKAESRRQWKTT